MKKYSPLVAVSLFALIAASPVLADDNFNTSNIDQIGLDLTATATQEGNFNNNTSDIDQGLIVPSFSMEATVTQHGDVNVNYALIAQDGLENEATVDQSGDHTWNEVEVKQVGFGGLNTANVTQGGSFNTNVAGVGQAGSNLHAVINQH